MNRDEQSDRYINQSGLVCPECQSREIEAGEFTPYDSMAWRDVCCKTCDSEWTEEFQLVRMDNLQIQVIDRGEI
jgi:hypothetical protein